MRGLSDFKPGDQFESPQVRVDEAQALAFARSFDPQPFHLDDAAARQTMFSGLATSGWFTAALCFRLIHDSGIALRGGIIGQKIEDLQWSRPVRPGDLLRVSTRVVEIRRSSTNALRGKIIFEHRAYNQNNEQVLLMLAHVLASDPGPGERSK